MAIQNVKNNLLTFFITFCLWIIRSRICNNETLGVISFMFLLQLCGAWQGRPSSLVRKPVFHSCRTYPHSSAKDFLTKVGGTLLSVLLAVSTHPSEETQSNHLLYWNKISYFTTEKWHYLKKKSVDPNLPLYLGTALCLAQLFFTSVKMLISLVKCWLNIVLWIRLVKLKLILKCTSSYIY